jgi:hypothetical protein
MDSKVNPDVSEKYTVCIFRPGDTDNTFLLSRYSTTTQMNNTDFTAMRTSNLTKSHRPKIYIKIN